MSTLCGSQPNKPLQRPGYVQPRLDAVASGKEPHCRRGTFRRPAAERRIR